MSAPRGTTLLAAVGLLATVLVGAASPSAADVRPPPVDAKADYQLGGRYPLPPGVTVVSRDSTDRPAAAAYNICYVNGYQTQPGRLAWWQRHHRGLLLRHDGRLVRDPGWPDEVLLDTSGAAKRRALARVVGRWVAGCAHDGFDAVEPDNLDSFTRSRGELDRRDNLAFARLLARRAHRHDLAIAQKNLAGVTRTLRREVGFDFAVAEECQVWRECGRYRQAYGRRVVEIEYTDNGRRAFRQACRRHGDQWSVILRDRMLHKPGHPRYTYRAC
jgi:hypothetical protein